MLYFITYNGKRNYYASIDAAKLVAAAIHQATGIIVGIEATPYNSGLPYLA